MVDSNNESLISQRFNPSQISECKVSPIRYQDIRRWRKERQIMPPEGGYEKFNDDWYQDADFSIAGDAVWWLGHATALIKINNKVIITDPIFSERASLVNFVGPKRRTPCASTINQLPQIDIVVISHNHYDHLDCKSMRQLIKRFPLVVIVVPLGLKKKIISWGANHVIELDWWQNTIIDNILVCATPAKYWSRRFLFDTNKTLWCGWVIQSAQRTIYFVGDTGYSPVLAEIKKHFTHIDIALIPIGSYSPRWFMHNQHIDPEQALQLFNDINCQRAIAIHWGAFELADDPLDEPPKLLEQLRHKYHVAPNAFLVIKIGECIKIDQ